MQDLKHFAQKKGKNKLFHIERGLYCAEKLMANELPLIWDIKDFKSENYDFFLKKEAELRNSINRMFETNELTMFPREPIVKPENELERLLIEANNIKEFKY